MRYVPHCPDDEEAKSLEEFGMYDRDKLSGVTSSIIYWKIYVLGGRFNGGNAICDEIEPLENGL